MIAAERYEFKCYTLNNIVYVPHLKLSGHYAYPGITKYDKPVPEQYLLIKNAKQKIELLYRKPKGER